MALTAHMWTLYVQHTLMWGIRGATKEYVGVSITSVLYINVVCCRLPAREAVVEPNLVQMLNTDRRERETEQEPCNCRSIRGGLVGWNTLETAAAIIRGMKKEDEKEVRCIEAALSCWDPNREAKPRLNDGLSCLVSVWQWTIKYTIIS